MNHNDPQIKEFFTKFVREKFPPNHIILPAQKEVNHMYYLLSGSVKQYSLHHDGRELVSNLFKPHTFFPLIPLFTGEPNRYFFETTKSCLTYKAPCKEVINYMRDHPDIMHTTLSRVLIGLDGLLQQNSVSILGTTYQKVVQSLLMLANRFGKTKQDHVVIDHGFTHKELSVLTGISRESVTRAINKLKRGQLVFMNRNKIILKDIEAMKAILLDL